MPKYDSGRAYDMPLGACPRRLYAGKGKVMIRNMHSFRTYTEDDDPELKAQLDADGYVLIRGLLDYEDVEQVGFLVLQSNPMPQPSGVT